MSSVYHIKALFITRKHPQSLRPEPPELVLAWDEYSVSEMPEEFQDACRRALESVNRDGGDPLDQSRVLEIKIDEAKLEEAFRTVPLEGAL